MPKMSVYQPPFFLRKKLFFLNDSEFNYTQWETKEVFEQRFLEKLDDEQVKYFFKKKKKFFFL
jgi:hypothetical protein